MAVKAPTITIRLETDKETSKQKLVVEAPTDEIRDAVHASDVDPVVQCFTEALHLVIEKIYDPSNDYLGNEFSGPITIEGQF